MRSIVETLPILFNLAEVENSPVLSAGFFVQVSPASSSACASIRVAESLSRLGLEVGVKVMRIAPSSLYTCMFRSFPRKGQNLSVTSPGND